MELFSFNINTILQVIDWRTFVDVPLIAMVILLFYRTLRSSGSWRIGLGIVMTLFIYLLARMFGLTGISWIFDTLSSIALIALIIIFQPEIRKIFEKTASTLRIRKLLKEGSQLSFVIANAAFDLARRKWGAIMILPGKESIRDKVSGGIPMNASPSVPLLVSLFDPHSPGHDGALIIDNGIIEVFALRLPLSTDDRYNHVFGTRHHASMGLSEMSDALIVTVSEERGVVSIFREGDYRVIDEKFDLERIIEEHWRKVSSFSPVKGNGGKLKGKVIGEVFASIVIAFVLWLSITFSMNQVKEMSFAVPIEYKLPQQTVIMGDKPANTRIKIAGTVAKINLVNPESLIAIVDLTDNEPGQTEIVISRENLNLPSGITVVNASPSRYEVSLQSYIEHEVKVKPQMIGALPNGLEIKSVEITPSKIPITYTTSREVAEDVFVTTTPIYLTNIKEDSELVCNVIAPPGMSPVGRQWPDVVVFIKLKK